jgi:uncharacterized protein (DUF736 family)
MFIGNFRSAGSSYTGVIQTLTFRLKAVFEPIEKKNEKSPDYRVTTGNTDIGVAWKTGENGCGPTRRDRTAQGAGRRGRI